MEKVRDKGNKENEVIQLREKEMDFISALKEIYEALKNEYEISHIKEDALVLLKYNKKEGLLVLAVEGRKDEINRILDDEIIHGSFL